MVILLVEDEPLIAMMLEGELVDAGYTVCSPASTAQRDLEIAERERPDLALVDINLGDGSSGTDLARELLNRWGVPSLFVSGQRMEAYANRDAALGYIGKPCSPETVLASIRSPSASWAASRRPPRKSRPGWSCSGSWNSELAEQLERKAVLGYPA